MSRSLPWLTLLSILLLAGCSGKTSAPTTRTGMTASADSVEIYYTVTGQGPAVVLVHCWGGNHGFFDSTVPALAPDYTVVTLDLAGHGRSGLNRSNFNINSFAKDVLAAMDAAGVEQAVLVGHSMGGLVCLEVARQEPSRVKGIVGVETLHQVEHGYSRQDIERLVIPMQLKFQRTVSDHARNLFPAGTDSNIVNLARLSMMAMPEDIAIQSFRNLFVYDVGRAADALQVPLYLIEDAGQRVNRQAWAAHGVQLRTATMHNVGHFPMFTKPEEFNRVLKQALAGF